MKMASWFDRIPVVRSILSGHHPEDAPDNRQDEYYEDGSSDGSLFGDAS